MTAELGVLYSSEEVVALTGISYRILHRWASAGVIESATPATGQGSRRRWNLDQIERLDAIARVRVDLECLGLDQMPAGIAETLWRALADRDTATLCARSVTVHVRRGLGNA